MSCCSSVFFGTNRHVALLYGGADRLGVVGIVLLPAYEWLHVLRRHDLHGVTELLELPLPIECARGSFDADEARLQFANHPQQQLAADPTYQYRASLAVDVVQLENILRQVDTEYLNLHEVTSLAIGLFAILAIGEGEPSIPLSGKRSTAGWRSPSWCG